MSDGNFLGESVVVVALVVNQGLRCDWEEIVESFPGVWVKLVFFIKGADNLFFACEPN